MFIFSPEKFVVLTLRRGQEIAMLALPLLDLVAIAALVVAIRNDKPFPPPLLVGYALTAIGGLTMILLNVYMRRHSIVE